MKFEDVLPVLREGKKVRRKCWGAKIYICLAEKWDIITNLHQRYIFNKSDLIDDDWEIIKETKKIKLRDLSVRQFIAYCNENSHRNKCDNCIFKNVVCDDWKNSCWIYHKELYNDKFLDQEIEIKE